MLKYIINNIYYLYKKVFRLKKLKNKNIMHHMVKYHLDIIELINYLILTYQIN